ncbi:hypothetical protein H6G00_01530 [Leptolyngbya sp. FACHB-541]|uniref:hypothetical protein n=1 Tax=Leptolyngbya sp. FACHB-541 TaxID=2692810 RepID=UPI00168602AC|nr:hypothetical protein [Leptolyngbya sp. FACHB-541]MBD1995311.1 hypothetical protein [Leptolyngbya sp. FACHB-541]
MTTLNNAYLYGKHLNPVLVEIMPEPYLEGMLAAKQRRLDKGRAGQHWVEDRRVNGGGYWRRNRGSKNAGSTSSSGGKRVGLGVDGDSAKVAIGLAGAAAIGAGLALAATRSGQTPEKLPEKPPEPNDNRAAIAATGVGAALGGIGVGVWATRQGTKQQVDTVRREADEQVKQQVAEAQKELAAQGKAQVAEEIERRTADIEQRVNAEAMERIAKEREAAMQDAQDKIVEATQPKPRRSGELVDDDEQGIALSASVRQGLDLGLVSEENQDRRIREATKRLATRKQREVFNQLNTNFRERTKEIQSMGGDKVPQSQKALQNQINERWGALEKVLQSQTRREGALKDEMERIVQETTNEYLEAMQKLRRVAESSGSYQPAQLAKFDSRSQAIHKRMKAQMDKALSEITRDIKLDSLGERSPAYLAAFQQVREDSRLGKLDSRKGVPCGEGWMSQGEECHAGQSRSTPGRNVPPKPAPAARSRRSLLVLPDGIEKGIELPGRTPSPRRADYPRGRGFTKAYTEWVNIIDREIELEREHPRAIAELGRQMFLNSRRQDQVDVDAELNRYTRRLTNAQLKLFQAGETGSSYREQRHFQVALESYNVAVKSHHRTTKNTMLRLRNELLGSSGVDSRQAKQLVESKVFFDSSIRTITQRNLVPMMTDFYQLVGSDRVGSTTIIQDKTESRAYANESGIISIGAKATSETELKRRMFHELGHAMEFYDPRLLAASTEWRDMRRTEPINREKLKKLDPIRKYEDDEVAFAGRYLTPYVGKDYGSSATEVMSMGLERFADEEAMTYFYNGDRQHFFYTLGALRIRQAEQDDEDYDD